MKIFLSFLINLLNIKNNNNGDWGWGLGIATQLAAL